MHFTFGLEIELLVKPKDTSTVQSVLASYGWIPSINFYSSAHERDANRSVLLRAVAHLLQSRGLAADTRSEDYETWSVVPERSLDERPGYWAIEVISRVLSTEEAWQDDVQDVFAVLNRHFDLLLTSGCSTHIHICPKTNGGSYTPPDVLAMLKAMAYFDDPLTRIMPPERKYNEYCFSNVAPVREVAPEISQAYRKVPAHGFKELFQFFETKVHKAAKKRGLWMRLLVSELLHEKYTSWNYLPLLSCGTIEFRRPPGVNNAVDACHWVAFTLGFASSALRSPWDQYEDKRSLPSVIELSRFVTAGATRLGDATVSALQREKINEDNRPPFVPTENEIRAIRAKKEKLKNEISPFARKASSRSNSSASSRSTSSSSSRRK